MVVLYQGLETMESNSSDRHTVLADRVQRLRRLDSCGVSDALDRLQLDGVASGIPQQSGNDRIAGLVTTVKLGVGTPLAGGQPKHLGTTAIELSNHNNVIVIEQSTGIEAACWGGLLTLGAKVRGVAGVIADGLLRDVDEARGLNFPIFANGSTARTARGRVIEVGTNVPITVWGIKVNPGDYVIADRSGVIFVSSENIDLVLDTAEAIVARESGMAKAILTGREISKVMGGNYEHMLRE